MKHTARILAVLSACYSSYAVAGSSLADIFSELRHDFGSIPRGADQRCAFVLTNNTDSAVRICGMERTCGCTQITLDDKVVLDQNIKKTRETKTIAPGETAQIGVVLDTRSFVGNKSADITVSFDQPSLADVRVTVTSFIRQDIVLNPGVIQFGSLSRGQAATRELEIEYAGHEDWQIVNVSNPDRNSLDVQYDEMYRKPGRIGYKLKVGIKPTVAPGFVRHELVVQTNDPASPQVPVLVTGQVQPDLIVTPSNLSLGTVRVGQATSRQVLLRAKKPFRLTRIDAPDERFQIPKSEDAQSLHKLSVRFTGSNEPGTLQVVFRVETDLQDEPPAEFKATVQVIP